jgi:hypothetical protein
MENEYMKYTELLWGFWGFFIGMVFASIYCGYSKPVQKKILDTMDPDRAVDGIFLRMYRSQPAWVVRAGAILVYILLLVIGYVISIRKPLVDAVIGAREIITILSSLFLQMVILAIFWLIIRSYRRGTLKYTHFKTHITMLGETRPIFLIPILMATASWHLILLVKLLRS